VPTIDDALGRILAEPPAAAGRGEVAVRYRPHVTVMSTGDELVGAGIDAPPERFRTATACCSPHLHVPAGDDPVRARRLSRLLLKLPTMRYDHRMPAKKTTSRKKTRKGSERKKTTTRKKTTSRKKTTRRKKTAGRKKTTRKKTSRKKSTDGRKKARRKYGKKAGKKVKRSMHELKRGELRSGRSGKKVTSRKQAIAIGLSEARRSGAKVPRKKSR
jgi:hypothetical protein